MIKNWHVNEKKRKQLKFVASQGQAKFKSSIIIVEHTKTIKSRSTYEIRKGRLRIVRI
jgi:hypothetical protein